MSPPEKSETEHFASKASLEVAIPAHGPPSDVNPYNWPKTKKWLNAAVAMFITYVSAFNATGNGAAASGVKKEFGISQEIFTTSSFTYTLCLGVVPLVLAPISENFGRRPMLVVLTGLIVLLWLPQALAQNIAAITITRFFQGAAASVEGPVIAGVIADMFSKEDRGTPMATFTLVVFGANATGPLACNWIAQEIGWRWVYWIQMCSNGLCFALTLLLFRETRGDILSRKLGQGNATGGGAAPGEKRGHWRQTVSESAMRPIVYLFTEPIVAALSLWIGFGWGIVFLFTGAVPHVFEQTYGFTAGQAGTVLITGFIGAFFGWLLNFGQNRLYREAALRHGGHPQPEARLYQAALGGILFGAGMFFFAWTARPEYHWIAPAIAVAFVNFGIYPIYVSVYAYMSDAYEKYSSSAQASQSLLRNVLGATFPFFGVTMYDNLTFPWASSLVGFIAFGLAAIPFLLLAYGRRIRLRSRVAREIAQREEAEASGLGRTARVVGA